MTPIISVEGLLLIYKDPNVLIFDVSNGPFAKNNYLKNHLNKAIFVDVNIDLATINIDLAKGGRHPLPSLEEFSITLGNLGISKDSHVVLYDDKNGANAAARFWWMLKSVGHKKVQVLDGGFQMAKNTGFPINSIEEFPKVKGKYKLSNWLLSLVSTDEVEKNLKNHNSLIIDVREEGRYKGEFEPIDLVSGHIPGAINIPFSTNLNKEGLFLEAKELKKNYLKIIKNRESSKIIVHCGSGVTACHTLLAFEIAGLDIPNLYIGSWSEWSRNEKETVVEK
ncbi:sulfurtransferase [Lutibacter citreus]|uniref:sulfurtransferase n=1 Tax=Lutibacter citreus TaxID=2138210 RepID=UPI001C5525FD|nr:sulfurtransferase [Lutibacter citreus]